MPRFLVPRTEDRGPSDHGQASFAEVGINALEYRTGRLQMFTAKCLCFGAGGLSPKFHLENLELAKAAPKRRPLMANLPRLAAGSKGILI